jgi:deoxyadenosine/deoxycytidine kinase
MEKRYRVEACGGIAAGKTAFASLLKKSDFDILYEDFTKSPFWEPFYCNLGKYVFETEISFILLHYHQIKCGFESLQKHLICDFSFISDLAFAKMGLNGSKLDAFECVLEEIKKELLTPDLIVYLDCDAQTQLKRIKRRARAEEKSINIEFLDSLNKALLIEVEKIKPKVPVITVDSAKKDFVHDKATKKEMIKLVDDFLKNHK